MHHESCEYVHITVLITTPRRVGKAAVLRRGVAAVLREE